MERIFVINGPNLNLLGEREPSIYGSTGLEQIEQDLQRIAGTKKQLECFQSNHEGALVDYVQERCRPGDGVILNAGAYTHTSIALRDALLAREVELVEVHISNIYRREPFRAHSWFSDIAHGVVAGLGVQGYRCALYYLLSLDSDKKE